MQAVGNPAACGSLPRGSDTDAGAVMRDESLQDLRETMRSLSKGQELELF